MNAMIAAVVGGGWMLWCSQNIERSWLAAVLGLGGAAAVGIAAAVVS